MPIGAHAVVDPAGAEPGLGDREARAPPRRSGWSAGTRTSSKRSSAWPPCSWSSYPKTVIGRTTVSPGVSRGTRIIACCRCRSASGSVLPITMKISHSRVHRAGDPPLAAVDDVLVAVADDPRSRCWWRRTTRRPARSSRTPTGSRPSSSGSSQRSCCSAVPNIASTSMLPVSGRRAVERGRGEVAGAAGDLGQRGVLEVGQAGAVLARRAGRGSTARARGPRRAAPASTGAVDQANGSSSALELVVEDRLGRLDVSCHEVEQLARCSSSVRASSAKSMRLVLLRGSARPAAMIRSKPSPIRSNPSPTVWPWR